MKIFRFSLLLSSHTQRSAPDWKIVVCTEVLVVSSKVNHVVFWKRLEVTHQCATANVRSVPHWFVGSGSGFGPPGLAGDTGRVGGDAGLACFHVAEHLNGISAVPLVRIDPVVS